MRWHWRKHLDFFAREAERDDERCEEILLRPVFSMTEKRGEDVAELLRVTDDEVVDAGAVVAWQLARGSIFEFEYLYREVLPSYVYNLLSLELALKRN